MAQVQELLKKAYRRTGDISFDVLSDGTVEICWLRRHTPYLAEVLSHTTASLKKALDHVIRTEDEAAHGKGCPCVDCSDARIDAAWRE